jgi:hypothetical protein
MNTAVSLMISGMETRRAHVQICHWNEFDAHMSTKGRLDRILCNVEVFGYQRPPFTIMDEVSLAECSPVDHFHPVE